MKRIHIFTLALLATVLVVTAGILWQAKPNESPAREQTATVSQDSIQRHRTDIKYTAKAGETSLAQLKREADDVVTKHSEYGEYVDSIEGSKGGTDGKYWSFYIDGAMASVGADSYTQKGGEVIEWKFQKL